MGFLTAGLKCDHVGYSHTNLLGKTWDDLCTCVFTIVFKFPSSKNKARSTYVTNGTKLESGTRVLSGCVERGINVLSV